MHKLFPIGSRQIKAARALLDWSQQDLATATNLSTETIRKVESGEISPRDKTMAAIRYALEEAKIEFTPSSGLRLRENSISMIHG